MLSSMRSGFHKCSVDCGREPRLDAMNSKGCRPPPHQGRALWKYAQKGSQSGPLKKNTKRRAEWHVEVKRTLLRSRGAQGQQMAGELARASLPADDAVIPEACPLWAKARREAALLRCIRFRQLS